MTNDALEALRSFRPEVTGPTDVLARDERNAFMQTIAHETADQPAPQGRSRRRLPRGRRVMLAFAVALVAVGGAAAAAGLIPDDVQRTLGLAGAGDPAFAPNVDEATKRASTTAADGSVVELWTAPTRGGGTCAYLRHLTASGTPSDGAAVTCQNTAANGATLGRVTGAGANGQSTGGTMTIGGTGGELSAQLQQDAGRGSVAYGKAPHAARSVIVTDGAGKHTVAAVDADGWFIVTLPTGTELTALKSIEARSAAGTTLARIPLAAAPGARVESFDGGGTVRPTPGG